MVQLEEFYFEKVTFGVAHVDSSGARGLDLDAAGVQRKYLM